MSSHVFENQLLFEFDLVAGGLFVIVWLILVARRLRGLPGLYACRSITP
jgi:hypothetical protein